jgi:hypothetical protein
MFVGFILFYMGREKITEGVKNSPLLKKLE